MANGHKAGHIKEFASPSNAINSTEIYPCEKTAANEKIIPSTAQYLNAFSCEKYFGMQIIPRIYPTSIAISVQVVKNFAVDNAMPCEAP